MKDDPLVADTMEPGSLDFDGVLSRLRGEDPPGDGWLAKWLYTMIQENREGNILPMLSELSASIAQAKGLQSAWNLLSRMQVAFDLRKPKMGIYDNAFHFIGGAQKYGCTIASALQEMFDITLLVNCETSLAELEDWYNLDLSGCRLKLLRLPYFSEQEKIKGVMDAGLVDLKGDNPFHVVSRESGEYDVFVNNCMLEMVYPLSPVSEFVCHFPEREISRFFHVDKYSHIIYNSRYTADWIRRRWKIEPQVHIYPPVDMESSFQPELKENIILSASRFELSGNKQQLEMVKFFLGIKRIYPEFLRGWRLLLAGGSVADNPYLERIRSLLASSPDSAIELKVNIPAAELGSLYRKAKLFWHLCGYKQNDPARAEHFGMTTAEAMQNGCVPIVFKGGGLPEIIADGKSGILFETSRELGEKTVQLIRQPERWLEISRGAYDRSREFTKTVFIEKIRKHFTTLLEAYAFRQG